MADGPKIGIEANSVKLNVGNIGAKETAAKEIAQVDSNESAAMAASSGAGNLVRSFIRKAVRFRKKAAAATEGENDAEESTEAKKAEARRVQAVEKSKETGERGKRGYGELLTPGDIEKLKGMVKLLTADPSKAKSVLSMIKEILPNDPSLHMAALEKLADMLQAPDITEDVGAEVQSNISKDVGEALDSFDNEYNKVVQTGENIFAKIWENEGGSSAELRGVFFKYITNEREDVHSLFNKLAPSLDTEEGKDFHAVLAFLFNGIGTELNAGGAEIEPGELHDLTTASKDLQALSNVMRNTFSNHESVKEYYKGLSSTTQEA